VNVRLICFGKLEYLDKTKDICIVQLQMLPYRLYQLNFNMVVVEQTNLLNLILRQSLL